MKYIRTKEYGVCKVINEDKNTLSYENSYVVGVLWKDDYKDKIQYGDTIEELCDEIVEIIDSKAQVIYADISFNDLAIAKIRDKNNAIIYGAIWTDKGLIYVAKMNEKGELELL